MIFRRHVFVSPMRRFQYVPTPSSWLAEIILDFVASKRISYAETVFMMGELSKTNLAGTSTENMRMRRTRRQIFDGFEVHYGTHK